ncbi:MAG: MFS transporter [Pseudomonadota bacterium]
MPTSEAPPRAPASRSGPPFVDSFCDPARRRLLLIAAILASALGFIDGSVVAIAIPAMRETLGASLIQSQWVHNAYLLTLAALTLTGGAAGDRFGLSRVFSAGITAFVAASMLCAAAPDTTFLIVARALQGMGAALMIPGSLALIARAYPEAERGRAIGIWAGAASVTTAAGPILGGIALSYGGPEMWRAIFAVNLPIGGAALWLIARAVREDPGKPGQPLDWLGATLAIAGLGLIACALSIEGLGTARWPLGVAGAAIVALFLWVEARIPAPMLDVTLFRIRSFSAANLLTFTFYVSLSTILFFLPMTLISGWGLTELIATFAFAPLSVFIPLLSTPAGKLSDRYGPGLPITIGTGLSTLAFLGLALVIDRQNYWNELIPLCCLMGMGMAFVVAPLSAAVMAGVDGAKTGGASGVNNAVSRIASLFAVASMGGVASGAYLSAGGVASFGERLVGDPLQGAATIAGFTAVAYACAILGAASTLVAWFGLPRHAKATA